MTHFRLNRAVLDACIWHHGQVRKYSGLPYITHPMAVMSIVREVTDDEDTLIAALFHDVLEDTAVSADEICETYGGTVASLVNWLTDVSGPGDGNRENRKRIDLEHIADAPAAAQTIKLADLIHNTSSIVQSDDGFSPVYMREKELLLEVLTKGDHGLWERAMGLIESYWESKA